MTVTLTADMRAVVQAAHLCFAATVTPDGKPNLSPKGTIRVWDDRHLFFLDLASPGTRASHSHHPSRDRAGSGAGVPGVLAGTGRASHALPVARAAEGIGSRVRGLPGHGRAILTVPRIMNIGAVNILAAAAVATVRLRPGCELRTAACLRRMSGLCSYGDSPAS